MAGGGWRLSLINKFQEGASSGVIEAMKALFMLLLSSIFVSSALAKRGAPAEVPSVMTPRAVFSVPHFVDEGESPIRGGVIEAHDPETKKLMWRVRVYRTEYDPSLESDVQDVFIKTLSYDKTHHFLIMSDEKGRAYVLNLANRKVTRIE